MKAIFVAAAAISLCGCAAKENGDAVPERTLTLAAYTTPREAYREILPAFAAHWKREHGEDLRFEESYLGSGAQARAVAAGFRADVAALSLEPDIHTLVKAGLVDSSWKSAPHDGIVSRSLVVFAVRPGNPRNIRTWDDLARPGVEVLTPNPATSGGAMWNIAALVGAALRGGTSAAGNDTAAAERLLRAVLKNVRIMDKGARESMLTFEQGVGDVAITYENEVLTARASGQKMDYVVPPSTIWIDNPAAVVQGYADRKNNRDVAGGLVAYLTGEEAQRTFAKNGYRPVLTGLIGIDAALTAAVPGAFSIESLGGWPHVVDVVFSPTGIFSRALQAVRR
jgi:sulfate/thiosulfate transport system substrate-binding protein